VLWHCWLGDRKGIRSVKMGDGGGGHWLVQLEWRPSGWSVCLPLLIFPKLLLHHEVQKFYSGTGSPRVVLEKGPWNGCVCVCVNLWLINFWYPYVVVTLVKILLWQSANVSCGAPQLTGVIHSGRLVRHKMPVAWWDFFVKQFCLNPVRDVTVTCRTLIYCLVTYAASDASSALSTANCW